MKRFSITPSTLLFTAYSASSQVGLTNEQIDNDICDDRN